MDSLEAQETYRIIKERLQVADDTNQRLNREEIRYQLLQDRQEICRVLYRHCLCP